MVCSVLILPISLDFSFITLTFQEILAGGSNRGFGKTEEDFGFLNVKETVKTHFRQNEEIKTADFSHFYHVKTEE